MALLRKSLERGLGPSIFAVLLWGCASPGVPKPPSLHLPEPVTSLTAERVGGEVRLTWTTPLKTTDGETIRGATTASVCRIAGRSPVCAPVRQVAVAPGPAVAQDDLPATLQVGADSVVMYKVELKNDRGRSAGPSAPALAAGGRAPEPPAEVSVRAQREGLLVTWQPENGGAPGSVVELSRTEPAVAAAATKAVRAKNSQQKLPFGGQERAAEGTVVLVAEAGGLANGMLDHSAIDGHTYTYAAQRVRTAQVAGHALVLRSAFSAPVTVTFRNHFAPEAPAGLAALPGGGFAGAPAIDLSWEANAEQDVVGYRVYRSVDGGAPVPVTATLLPGPAYRDAAVTAGHRYGYRVTAVDVNGNESASSPEAVESLREAR